jgi:hypothetical protein
VPLPPSGCRSEPAVEGLEPVAQADQAGSVRPGAADAVVAHGDAQGAVLDVHADVGARARACLTTFVSASATTK